MADWFYIVDAQSGKILYKLNQLTDVTGDGDVYPTYPGLSSVTNKPLYRLNGNGSLDGVFANIVNDAVSEAYSASNSFQYSPSNTHFDEANLYYHIDDFRHNFIDAVDDGSLGLNQITAHAHSPIQDLDGDGDLDPNAYFSRNTHQLYFNDEYSPAGTKDFAKEDKVIQHEYSHAVIYDIQSGIRSEFSEEGAISESTPDYFAGSFKDRAQIGNYVFSFPLRDMENPEFADYSDLSRDQNGDVNADSHDGGEFFSAILWDLRNGSVGKSATDFLVYDALYRVTSDPDFLDFRDAMMAADYEAYQGYDADLVQNTFAGKGVGQYVPPGVSIQGPTGIFSGQTKTYTAYVSGGFPPFQYKWYYQDTQNSPWIGPVSTDDTYDYTAHSAPNDYLKLTVTDQHNSIIVQKRLTVAGLSN